MVKIVLETGVLDVSEKTNFPVTFNIGDIRDLSARKGTFSKSITLEGTKNNHELLGHYYDVKEKIVYSRVEKKAHTRIGVTTHNNGGFEVIETADKIDKMIRLLM